MASQHDTPVGAPTSAAHEVRGRPLRPQKSSIISRYVFFD